MKHTFAILLLALSLCAPGMAQTKGKQALPQQGSTIKNGVPFGAGSSTSGPLVFATTFSTPPPPIVIDGESTDCTREHLVKALKIVAAMIADPNQPLRTEGYGISYLTNPLAYTVYQYPQKPSDEKRAQAERLKAEADRLEAESKRVQWVRAVLAGCEK